MHAPVPFAYFPYFLKKKKQNKENLLKHYRDLITLREQFPILFNYVRHEYMGTEYLWVWFEHF